MDEVPTHPMTPQEMAKIWTDFSLTALEAGKAMDRFASVFNGPAWDEISRAMEDYLRDRDRTKFLRKLHTLRIRYG